MAGDGREHVIVVEPGAADAFRPFGELILPPEGEPVYRGIQPATWPTGFRCDDEVHLMYTRFGWQAPVFTRLERHRGVTQTFIALAPRAFVMVVAAPTKGDAWPAPDAIRAFLVPPGAGVIIGETVWHALDRFLLEPEPLDCLMLTSAGVQEELEAQYRGGAMPKRTDVIDFAANGLSFRLSPLSP
jgi:ureidoglycolate hydrolase